MVWFKFLIPILTVSLIGFACVETEKKKIKVKKPIDKNQIFYDYRLNTFGEVESLKGSKRDCLRLLVANPQNNLIKVVSVTDFKDFFLLERKEVNAFMAADFTSVGVPLQLENEWKELQGFIKNENFFSVPEKDPRYKNQVRLSRNVSWVLEVKIDNKYNRIFRELETSASEVLFYNKVLEIIPDSLKGVFPEIEKED